MVKSLVLGLHFWGYLVKTSLTQKWEQNTFCFTLALNHFICACLNLYLCQEAVTCEIGPSISVFGEFPQNSW